MKLLVHAILLLSTLSAAAQRDLRIKLYHNSDFVEEIAYGQSISQQERAAHFRRFSLAIEFGGKSGLAHQFELFLPQVERPTRVPAYPINCSYPSQGYDYESTVLAFRYELTKKFGIESGRARFAFGLGLNPYYQKLSLFPEDAGSVKRSTENFGGVVNAIAGIGVTLSKKLGVELSIPLKVYDFRGRRQVIKNPTLPVSQQSNSEYDPVLFESAYTIRFGLSYRLR